jgi:hypothetical protein
MSCGDKSYPRHHSPISLDCSSTRREIVGINLYNSFSNIEISDNLLHQAIPVHGLLNIMELCKPWPFLKRLKQTVRNHLLQFPMLPDIFNDTVTI